MHQRGAWYFNVIARDIKNYVHDMGWACSAYGGEERRLQGLGEETWRKETTWETKA